MADVTSFFLTPCIFEEAVLVFGLNSLGSSFFDSTSVLLAYWKRLGRNLLHFGHNWFFGYGFTIVYPQFSHITRSFLEENRGLGIQNQLQ
jgi:hypothetical protein